jgi:hypothetical protein
LRVQRYGIILNYTNSFPTFFTSFYFYPFLANQQISFFFQNIPKYIMIITKKCITLGQQYQRTHFYIMGKEKIKMEYMLKGGSSNVIWNIISTPSGLETWFADKVSAKDKRFTFRWGKTEIREADLINYRANSFVRFHWLDDEERKSYFELKIVYNELTEDLMLEVTDWAEAGEGDDVRDLWDSDIEKLKRVSGL